MPCSPDRLRAIVVLGAIMVLSAMVLSAMVFASAAFAQSSPPPFPHFDPPAVTAAPPTPAPPAARRNTALPPDAALRIVNAKFNAYVAFLNRTLRAMDSLDRYKSWVNMKTGPTGRERIIYGLYSVYDTQREEAEAIAATRKEPLIPDLDAAMRDYVAANAALAPVLNEANAYYDRADYKIDHMAGGKALHVRIAANANPFVAARAAVETLLDREKTKVDALDLAATEEREGRRARWNVQNVMIRAKKVVERLPRGVDPAFDLSAFDEALGAYGAAVKEMDDYAAKHPDAFFVFESQPRSLLGKLREMRDPLARTRGKARGLGGMGLSLIVDQYNLMVTTSRTATQFSKEGPPQ